MGFLDNSQQIISAILTRKGRELIAKNNGEFRITSFAFGDDEINYQLYNAATNDDTDILNLPILEPSSNELTALRYRLVTAPVGSISVATLVVFPLSLLLQNRLVNPSIPNIGVISIVTRGGVDSSYIVTSRNPRIAFVPILVSHVGNWEINSPLSDNPPVLNTETIIKIQGGDVDGTTLVDIVGNDTGASISIPITTTSVLRSVS